MKNPLHRSVIFARTAENEIDRYTQQYPRFEDAFFDLLLMLACNPALGKQAITSGGQLTERRLYRQASDTAEKTPTIWVVYSFTRRAIIVHGACSCPDPSASDDRACRALPDRLVPESRPDVGGDTGGAVEQDRRPGPEPVPAARRRPHRE